MEARPPERRRTALVLLGLQLLNLFVAQRLGERRRVLVLAVLLVVGQELVDRLSLAVADARVWLVHHALHIAAPLRQGHGGVNGPRDGVALGTLVHKHLVPLLLIRRISGDVDLVRHLLLRERYVAALRSQEQRCAETGERHGAKSLVHFSLSLPHVPDIQLEQFIGRARQRNRIAIVLLIISGSEPNVAQRSEGVLAAAAA